MGNKLYSRSKNNDNVCAKESFLSTLRRKSTLRVRKSWVPRAHLDITKWLEALDLTQYEKNFKKFGGVEDMLYYDESKIKHLGIKVSSHRARIMSSLYSLREKYEKNQKLKLDLNLRASLIEGEDLEIAKIHIQNNSDVVFRNGNSTARRIGQKREGALLTPDTIVTMSFGTNENKKANIGENEMKKLLEWELSLDSSDLRSHAWYHGSIPRGRAEDILKENGQFLIRDCISQPGDYVLSCFTKCQVLHFVIQKVIAQPNTIYERVQYQFEGDCFDSIPDLITAYVGGRKFVTVSSGSKINIPVNRTFPLTYYASKYMAELEHVKLHGTLSRVTPNLDKRSPAYSGTQSMGVSCSIVKTVTYSPRLRRSSGPTGITRYRRPSSEVSPGENIIGSDSKTNAETAQNNTNFSSLPRKFNSDKSSTIILSSSDIKIVEKPPPKPSRTPSTKLPRKELIEDRTYEEIEDIEVSQMEPESSETQDIKDIYIHSKISEVYQQSGSDSGNGSGDSVQTSYSDTKTRDSEISLVDSCNISTEKETVFVNPLLDPPSSYDLENFSTLLLPSLENKPLDATALRGVKNILTECGSRVMAAHLTHIDLNLLNGPIEKDFGLGVTMGIEMMSLPHGSQLRKDIIERTECMKLFVAITILKEDDINVRAELIHRWIQIAIDTKTAMGNLFGFTTIMLGLCIPEIQRLSHTWHMVRQKFTDSAFNFESKLRNTLKNMNECTNPQAPNTIIPHILPFVILCERDLDDIYAQHNQGDSLLQWESNGSDHGLQMLLNHLQECRSFCLNLRLYKRNEQIIMGDMQKMDELTLDMFSTEFHLKFLFGSKAAYADSRDRLSMFQRVVSTLSEYCEPYSNDGLYTV